MRPGRQLRRAPSSILNNKCTADTAYYGAATSDFRWLFIHRGGKGDVRAVGRCLWAHSILHLTVARSVA